MKKLLSLIALAGIFAACQPEELKTSFTVDPAEVTINVRVVDIRTGAVLTSGFEIEKSAGEVVGNAVVIKGDEKNPAIDGQNVTVTVKYKADYMSKEQSQSETVSVAKLRAGGKAIYSVSFVVGYPDSKYTITCAMTKPGETSSEKKYFDPSDSHAETHTHDGGLWVRNNTEFILTGVVTWYSYNGALATYTMNESLKEDVKEDVEELETVVKDYAKLFTYGYNKDGKLEKGEKHELNLQVSAYCYYTAYQINTKVTGREYTVSAEKDGKEVVVGTITVKSNTSSSAEYEEMGDPNAHGHYVYGHGHAHGHGTDNAGGGIVTPE